MCFLNVDRPDRWIGQSNKNICLYPIRAKETMIVKNKKKTWHGLCGTLNYYDFRKQHNFYDCNFDKRV